MKMKRCWWLILILAGCSKVQMDDCITAAGPVVSIERELEGFNAIVSSDKLKVTLVQDTSQSERIIIRGPRNLVDQITTQIEDGTLYLDNTNTCNFMRSFKLQFELEVHLKDIDKLVVNSASEVYSIDSLHLANLTIIHEALADVDLLLNVENSIYVQSFNSAHTRLRGQAKSLTGSIEEVSDLNAQELVCEEVLLDQHSPIDCYIDGTKIIFVKIYNDGNIYYKREPSKYKDLNYKRGSGDLILIQ